MILNPDAYRMDSAVTATDTAPTGVFGVRLTSYGADTVDTVPSSGGSNGYTSSVPSSPASGTGTAAPVTETDAFKTIAQLYAEQLHTGTVAGPQAPAAPSFVVVGAPSNQVPARGTDSTRTLALVAALGLGGYLAYRKWGHG